MKHGLRPDGKDIGAVTQQGARLDPGQQPDERQGRQHTCEGPCTGALDNPLPGFLMGTRKRYKHREPTPSPYQVVGVSLPIATGREGQQVRKHDGWCHFWRVK